ncbi:MAG: hypothetical protein M3383_07530 [Actinomycetota bacterium]|nr:hypothetical protein [Actinomycetota bacterium]
MRLFTIALLGLAVALSACGAEDDPAPMPTDAQVIEDWAQALSEGDTEAAAAFFAIPSVAENGILVEIESEADAVAFNSSLPCGAEVEGTTSEGSFTTASFRLTERPGGGCGTGTGGTAQTSFVIESGLIVEWRRIDGPQPEPDSQSVA